MTKIQYIKEHPKSYLAMALNRNTWPDDRKIEILSGQEAPANKTSNLYKALTVSQFHAYERGGKLQNRSDGFWFAVA